MDKSKNFFTSTAGILLVIITLLCCCGIILAAGGLGALYYFGARSTSQPGTNPSSFDPVITPTPVTIIRPPLQDISPDTLDTLKKTIVPENNPPDLACRLEDKCNLPATLPSGPFRAGDKQKFWVTNTDTAENFQVDATLAYVTDAAYFWVEDDVRYNLSDAKTLVDTFSNQIYPTDREFFGSEPNPGVDNDSHIYILYARGIGNSTAGYFSSSDAFPPAVKKYSNAHEMFVFNADNSPLDDKYTYGVLAHEFQHMIHFGQDRNETSWINEGFSELAVLLNGYSTGFKDYAYTSDPDLQLTDWGSSVGSNGPYYGASFLFMTYFLDRFGKEATQALVHDPENSMDSVDNVLKSIHATDSVTGQPVTADDFFMDWAATNDLLDGSVADGRYIYKSYESASKVDEAQAFTACPADYTDTVRQYGVDYIRFACKGQFTLRFEGSTTTTLLPVDAYSGKMAFWSNKGDESDMTLTREFDFTSTSAPLEMQYQTWYDLEEGYDYAFVEASTDGGKTWQILKTPSGTDENPSGNSYGWGYNGKSNGWLAESVDLSAYAGQKVQLRFEYITDAAVNGEGLLVDDIAIPAIGYSADFESDDGGWQGNGFVRVENVLPQTFRLTLITKGSQTNVQTITVNPDQTAQISLDFSQYKDAVLLVSGVTRFTRGEGSYSVSVR